MKILRKRRKFRRLSVLRHKMRTQITVRKKKQMGIQVSDSKKIATPSKDSLLAIDAYNIRDEMILRYLKQEPKLTPQKFNPVKTPQSTGNLKLIQPLGPLPRDRTQAIDAITTLVTVPKSMNKKEIMRYIQLITDSPPFSGLHENSPHNITVTDKVGAKARLLSKILYAICRLGQRGKDVEKLIEFRDNLQKNVDPIDDEVYLLMARLFSEISDPPVDSFPTLLADGGKILSGEVQGAFRVINSLRRRSRKKIKTM